MQICGPLPPQTSEDSADEWQQTKTTEDEAIEAL